MAEANSSMNQYMASIRDIRVLPKEEYLEIARQYRAGDESKKDVLIRHNLRLVVKFARAYGQDEDRFRDMVSEGNLGLIRAVEKFDPEHGKAFSTYAEWWIRYFIETHLNKTAKMVDVPLHTMKLVRKVNRTIQSHEQNQIEWTVESIADELGIKKSKVEAAIALSLQDSSMNKVIGDDEGGKEFGEFLEAPGGVEEQAQEEMRDNWIHLKVNELNPKQKDVIIHFFGLFNTKKKSGEELGRLLGVSRERVRQIRVEAINVLSQKAQKEGISIAEMAI